MESKNKSTLLPKGEKGEIVLYQPDEKSVSSIWEYTAADVRMIFNIKLNQDI